MRIYYFNDEKEPVYIHVSKLGNIEELLPQTGKTYHIRTPLNDASAIPFIKRWPSRDILLSYRKDPI